MAYFGNETVNRLNLHYAIHALAITGGGAFFGAFLLRAGVSAPGVLAALAAILFGRFMIRPAVLVLAQRWGLRPLVIAGTVISALQYPLLAEVHGVGVALLVLCAVSSAGDTLYWTSYHAYFAALGDDEHRGHQIGAREAIAAVVGIVGPLAAGWGLTQLGARITFGATAAVLVAAALPILRTPNVTIAQTAPGAFRASLKGVVLFALDGWIAAGIFYVWQITLFVTLGENFTAFGGAMALSALVGAILGLLLGRSIDQGHGRRAVRWAVSALVAVIVLRAGSYGNPVLAVAANAAGALVTALYIPTLMTAVYNQAKGSPCALRFHMATEGGWDAGCAGGCLTAAALIWAGAPLWLGILPALLGAGAMAVLLGRYYGGQTATDTLV